jgi:hypothetical protein
MTIKRTYVGFEQAKLLKEKGCKLRVPHFYNGLQENELQYSDVIGTANHLDNWYPAPEQWQVVEWLRINHGIWVSVDMIYEIDQTGFWYSIRQSKDDDMGIFFDEYPTPQEAYSAAFDYILNKLI